MGVVQWSKVASVVKGRQGGQRSPEFVRGLSGFFASRQARGCASPRGVDTEMDSRDW